MPSTEIAPGVDIAYDRTGSGPPLLLVHGITESRHSFDPLIPRLAEGFDVIAVDLRGHGESSRVAPYDVATLAVDLATLVGRLDVHRPLLVGHSLGGAVVSAMASLAEPVGLIDVDQPLALSGFQAALVPAAGLIRGSTTEFRGFVDAMFASMDGPLPAAERARIAEHADPDQEVVNGVWSAVIDGSAADLDAMTDGILRGIHAPFLSLHGIDPGPGYANWLTARCPTAQVEVWPDHGHYPHLVDPQRFLARVEAFAGTV